MHSLRGNGAILSSSYLHVLPQSQLTAAGLRAAGYEPQGQGWVPSMVPSTIKPFPHLSLPQQLSWHHLGHWAPLTLHSGAAGPVVHGLVAQRAAGHTDVLGAHLFRAGVLWDVSWREQGLPCLGTKARDQHPALMVEAS